VKRQANSKVKQELETILHVLSQYPNGVGSEEIRSKAGLDIELRTVQRRLAQLVKRGSVRTTGKSVATLYNLVREQPTVKPDIQSAEAPLLSRDGQEVLALIKQPLEARTPVAYNRSFLDAYQPNVTSYLNPSEKALLAQIGTTTIADAPAGTYARQVLNRLLIDLSWNSSRLEGNTYSLLDTQRLLAEGVPATEKSATETQMILNHKDAIEFIVQSEAGSIGFNRYTITGLHALLSNNLLADPAASGRLRNFAVGIHQSVYTPLAVPQLIEELFDSILQKAELIKDPFEQAFFAMVHLPYLQPFDDVNKRVSRLAANIPLNRHNLAPLSFTDVPQDLYVAGLLGVYELNRIALLKDIFIWAYGRSAVRYAALRQTVGQPDPFRLKYRDLIRTLINGIIADVLTPSPASERIKAAAAGLPATDQQKFIEAVDTELLSLHEGNFARYLVTPAQFQRWKETW
jgi:hypothetical protein